MNTRSGMQVKAFGFLGKKYETLLRREKKKVRRINKIMVVPRPLTEDEADRLAMKLFRCNADEARKMLSIN